jgi:hypothetical protein
MSQQSTTSRRRQDSPSTALLISEKAAPSWQRDVCVRHTAHLQAVINKLSIMYVMYALARKQDLNKTSSSKHTTRRAIMGQQ